MDEIAKALLGFGPAGILAAVFLYFWRQEVTDRKEAQKETADLAKRSIEADFTMAKAVDGLRDSLNTLSNAITMDMQRRP